MNEVREVVVNTVLAGGFVSLASWTAYGAVADLVNLFRGKETPRVSIIDLARGTHAPTSLKRQLVPAETLSTERKDQLLTGSSWLFPTAGKN